MSLENLFDFFGDPGQNPSGSITPSEEGQLVSRFIPVEIVTEVEAMGPQYKSFLDVILVVKGVDAFRGLDERLGGGYKNLQNTKKSYELQKSVELEKFYNILTRCSPDSFLEAIKKSSYKRNTSYVAEVLEYLINYYLLPEEYEKCAEIKKYVDLLSTKP